MPNLDHSKIKTKLSITLIWYVIAGGIALADQLSKWVVMESITLYDRIDLLPFFSWTYVQNHGAAFSFLADQAGWQRWFLVFIAVLISLLLVVWLYRLQAKDWLLSLALACILGGAVGNLLDRFYLGFVVDFISLHWRHYYFPAFNVADMAICFGAAVMLWDAFFPSRSKEISGESHVD